MATAYTAVRMTDDGIVISCSKEIDCWNYAQCKVGFGFGEKCLVQKAHAQKILKDGRVEPNKEHWWRRNNEYGCRATPTEPEPKKTVSIEIPVELYEIIKQLSESSKKEAM